MFKSILINHDHELHPLCLDFANTLRWHASEHPRETLKSYTDLVAWARIEKVLSDHEAEQLLNQAVGQPAIANQVYKRAIALREAIYRIFVTLIRGQSPAKDDLANLNDILMSMTRGVHVTSMAQGFEWQWDGDNDALDSFFRPISLSAAELLISEQRHRVGQCADDRGCGWLFLDTSKNHSRRWCDINDCGNRAKQHRHYQRRHKTA